MSDSRASAGIGLSTLLVVIFFVLKEVHVINWSWWYVFSPWLIELGIFGVILLAIAFVAGIAAVLD